MDRMNETQATTEDHVGWPTIFPDVPEFLAHALSFFSECSRQAHSQSLDVNYVGDRQIAHGQAYAFNAAAEWLAEDLARGMWFGDGNALVWVERR